MLKRVIFNFLSSLSKRKEKLLTNKKVLTTPTGRLLKLDSNHKKCALQTSDVGIVMDALLYTHIEMDTL